MQTASESQSCEAIALCFSPASYTSCYSCKLIYYVVFSFFAGKSVQLVFKGLKKVKFDWLKYMKNNIQERTWVDELMFINDWL